MATSNSPGPAAPTPEDQAAAAAVPMRVVEAWAAHDPGAFSGVFTADGTMILPGVYLKGRDEIRSHMEKEFAGRYKGTRVTGQPLDFRFITPSVGLLITEGGVMDAGQAEVSAENAIRATWFLVKQDGQWALAAYQNCPRDEN